MSQDCDVYRFHAWADIGLGDLVRQEFPLGAIQHLIKLAQSAIGAIGDLLRPYYPGASGALDRLTRPPDLTNLTATALQVLNLIRIPLEISGCNFSHGLNEIPVCSLVLPVGRDARDVTQPSMVHILDKYLKQFMPVSVYLKVERKSDTGPVWPTDNAGNPKAFRIFDGRTVGAGFRSSFGGAEYVLTLAHWTSDLNFSSMLSRLSHPANPFSVSFDAVMSGMSSGLSDDFRTIGGAVLTGGVIQQDFWGYKANTGEAAHGLLRWFLRICETDRFNWKDIDQLQAARQLCPGRGSLRKTNTEAIAALRRFEPLPTGQYRLGTALPIQDVVGLADLQLAIGTHVGNLTAETLFGTTIWDKLVGDFASQYFLAVVPLVETALVIPFTPGLRAFYTTLTQNDYDAIDLNVTIPRPIRGVGLITSRGTSTGVDVNSTNNPANKRETTGALYDTCKDGLILFKHPPAWVGNVLLPIRVAGNPVIKTVSTAGSPAKNPDLPVELNEPLLRVREVWQNIARAFYIQEVLRHRQARIQGRLRFDICPGTSLCFEAPEEKFIGAILRPNGERAPHHYGTVTRVDISIDCENQKAGTTFQVGFVRSDAENTDDDTSCRDHPVWKVPPDRAGESPLGIWRGAPLIDDPAFIIS